MITTYYIDNREVSEEEFNAQLTDDDREAQEYMDEFAEEFQAHMNDECNHVPGFCDGM